MTDFDYLEPASVAEACQMLRRYGPEARVYAGGAYLSILMKQGLLRPKALVNIKRIPALRKIRHEPGVGLVLGAAVTHRELETSPIVREKMPLLAEMERDVANVRVRNVATLGGNLASGEPLTDLAQVLLALDARIEIAGPEKERTIPVGELFVDYYQTSLAPEEIITGIVVPPLPPRSGVEYIRFSSSSVVDKPCVGVAVRLTLDERKSRCVEARVALGCVAPVPMRAVEAERVLTGGPFGDEPLERAAAAAAAACRPLSDLRGSERYKRAIVATLVKRAGRAAYQRAAAA
jgi:carbon-monoxide dehydrogenase medium subunit